MIDEIMDSFNFRKVVETMNLLQWKVYMGEKYDIPNEYELRKMARNDMWSLVDSVTIDDGPYCWSHCGPFKITIYKENKKICLISLDFVVTSMEVSDDDIEN